jgi:hypothetical protein
VANFSHFVKNIFNKKYTSSNSMIFLGQKIRQKSDQKKFQENQQKLVYKYEKGA